jgi:hypothetical protein
MKPQDIAFSPLQPKELYQPQPSFDWYCFRVDVVFVLSDSVPLDFCSIYGPFETSRCIRMITRSQSSLSNWHKLEAHVAHHMRLWLQKGWLDPTKESLDPEYPFLLQYDTERAQEYEMEYPFVILHHRDPQLFFAANTIKKTGAYEKVVQDVKGLGKWMRLPPDNECSGAMVHWSKLVDIIFENVSVLGSSYNPPIGIHCIEELEDPDMLIHSKHYGKELSVRVLENGESMEYNAVLIAIIHEMAKVRHTYDPNWTKLVEDLLSKAKQIKTEQEGFVRPILDLSRGNATKTIAQLKRYYPEVVPSIIRDLHLEQERQQKENPLFAFLQFLEPCPLLGDERIDVNNAERQVLNQIYGLLQTREQKEVLKRVLASSTKQADFVLAENDAVQVKMSKIRPARWGLYAKKDMKARQVVDEYKGQALSPEEYIEKYPARIKAPVYTIEKTGERDKVIGFVDAEDPARSSFARWSNSPLTANAHFDQTDDGKINMITLREVKAGEEIFVSYGANYSDQTAFERPFTVQEAQEEIADIRSRRNN